VGVQRCRGELQATSGAQCVSRVGLVDQRSMEVTVPATDFIGKHILERDTSSAVHSITCHANYYSSLLHAPSDSSMYIVWRADRLPPPHKSLGQLPHDRTNFRLESSARRYSGKREEVSRYLLPFSLTRCRLPASVPVLGVYSLDK
jgi:hypothetical protein